MVEPADNSTSKPSNDLSLPTGDGIVLDIGTGDGRFVYLCARQHPKKFFIGIDANPRPLEKVSEKIHRKPSKGGLPNVLFLQSSVEDLPSELDGVADEVHVHFPWGSLLRAVATGDEAVLQNLRRVCAAGALLEVAIGLDMERDRAEMERLGLETFSAAHVNSVLVPLYEKVGFKVLETGALPASEWSRLQTSWAKRLKGNVNRMLFYIVARAAEVER
ncbi:MAG: methyltransferase domain-containing protein [Pyrinomonadaceae bacterium]|nr:class I SAM-dependent methyltransferase [Acidobacteriota bacterium]